MSGSDNLKPIDMKKQDRRKFLKQAAILTGGLSLGFKWETDTPQEVLNGVRMFLHNVANKDGSFRPGIDPGYPGKSDTGLSGIAAPAYATILCKTFGWPLPYPDQTKDFFINSQKPDGAFYSITGSMDPDSPLSKLYNTVQSVVALRLMGEKPKYDPIPVIEYFFRNDEFKDLPLYTTSFFSLFYHAIGEIMPAYIDKRMRGYILSEQTEDGYLRNHVASTFHAAHYFRHIGQPTPKASKMVERVLNDQQEDGSWRLHPPSWDVHACFDALFILRQLADPGDPRVRMAYNKATEWILECRKQDGGFGHYPEEPVSDVDAVYFHVGGLVQTGYLKTRTDLVNEEILGWGHAMDPAKRYSCID
jgi:prenyltransferase beta subunit